MNLTVWCLIENVWIYLCVSGSGSSVGIATAYGLDGPGIESRWVERFYAHVQTGPEAQPASCTMDTGSFPVVRSGRGVTLTPHPLLVSRSKNRLELYLYSHWRPLCPVKGWNLPTCVSSASWYAEELCFKATRFFLLSLWVALRWWCV